MNNLYFDYMSGVGCISCLDCSHLEGITPFIHFKGNEPNELFKNDMDDYEFRYIPSKSYVGLQCQSCGRFHTVKDWRSSGNNLCDCGGLLSREEPIFCPKCKSNNLKYNKYFSK